MNINFSMSGVGSTAHERALALVQQAIAKREAELASTTANGSSANQSRPPGGK